MRTSSMVGVVALALAVAAIGGGAAFAQTPVVPAATVAAEPDTQSKTDPKDGEDKSKAGKPALEAPKLEKSGKSRDDEPTTESPTPAEPAPESPTPAQATPESAKPQPKPAQPKPAQPKPAQPKRQAGGVSNERGAQPEVHVAKPPSPRPDPAPPVAASDVQHVTTTPGLAATQNRAAASRSSGPEPSRTSSPRRGGDSADATAVAGGTAAAAPARAPRLVSDGVAAGAAASLDRQQPPLVILGGPAEYNVAPPLLLAIVFAAGVGYLFGREVRRGRGLAARRPAPVQRGARRRPVARRERVDRRLRRRLLGTRPNRPPARRSASWPLIAFRRSYGRGALLAFRATGGSRRR